MKGGEIVVSVQEERLLRRKRWKIAGAQHSLALDYCLDYAGIKPSDLSLVVLSAPMRGDFPLHDLRLNPRLQVELNKIETLVIPHHYAHAVSAFATSGFDESAVLVIDGFGSDANELFPEETATIKGPTEGWEMISLYEASGVSLKSLEKHITEGFDWYHTYYGPGMPRFRSLGSIFSSAAEQIFGGPLDAGKVMGLAPYGSPTIAPEEFFEIIDGQFKFHDKVPARFAQEERWPLRAKEYQDLARSAQEALEKAILYLVEHLHDLCPSDNLSYAGGVALNSVANERIVQESRFKNVYIIPAAEDSGPAIGAAYYGAWRLTQKNERRKLIADAAGREYTADEIREAVEATPAVEIVETDDVLATTVELMCQGKNIGWFQGRSELGPRARGQRSIICDPRRPDAKEILNREVKHREAFRPFAPVIPLEDAPDWFEWGGASCESPHMLRIAKFRPEKVGLVPAVEHVDNTGRVQTVTREANGVFYDLVTKFKERTGVPIILNTSFNVMGMPIVESPEDALFCLLSTGLDYCVLGDTIVGKREKVLLGAGGMYHKPVAGHRPWRLDKYDVRHVQEYRQQPGATASNALAPLAGVYQNYFGVIVIAPDGDGLKASFKGYAAKLEQRPEGHFIAAGEIFNESVVAFMNDDAGVVDRLMLIPRHGEAWGEIAKDWLPISTWDPEMATFRRMAEGDEASDRLSGFAGEYALGDEIIEVAQRADGKLVVTAAGQPDYELVENGGDKFDLRNTPGYAVEFRAGDDGTGVVEAVVTQPNGTFTLSRVSESVPMPMPAVCVPSASEFAPDAR
jgi:carbamoyltransferase